MMEIYLQLCQIHHQCDLFLYYSMLLTIALNKNNKTNSLIFDLKNDLGSFLIEKFSVNLNHMK